LLFQELNGKEAQVLAMTARIQIGLILNPKKKKKKKKQTKKKNGGKKVY
jgi:hypothetical protein